MTEPLKTRKNRAHQPAPILQFWEVPEHSIRVVDFADKTPTAITGEVTFRGSQWTPTKLSVAPIKSSAGGGETVVTVSVHDDADATLARYLHANNGIRGAVAKSWTIAHDCLSDSSLARAGVFSVLRPVMTAGGITFELGFPVLARLKSPPRIFQRHRCWNSYSSRNKFGNDCTYPSDYFTDRTAQVYRVVGSVDTETLFAHGYRTLNISRASEAHQGTAKLCRIDGDGSAADWDGATRAGPYIFRLLDGGDFDVDTSVNAYNSNSGEWLAGILVQDASSEGDWILAGYGYKSDQRVWTLRRTAISSSSDQTIVRDAGFAPQFFRLRRVGDTFTMFYRNVATDAWTQIGTDVELELPDKVRVGLVLARGTAAGGADFDYVHFESGGLPDCGRLFADCQLRNNTADFNGFKGLRDVAPRF